MTDTTLTIILGALPPTIAAVAGLIVSVVNARSLTRVHNTVEEIKKNGLNNEAKP